MLSMSPVELSVITPVLNGARFMALCVENVLAQNCPSCEHLIIDGGSSDETLSILQGYSRSHQTIRWVSKPGANQTDAMNIGLDLSHGSIVSVLNVDDFYADRVLNEVLRLFLDLPCPTLLVGNCGAWSDGVREYINRPCDLRFSKLLLGPEFVEFPYNPSAYFYHKKLHDIIGPYHSEDDYTMDVDFLFQAVQVANLVYVDKVLGNFRLHSESKTVRDKASGGQPLRLAAVLRRYRKQLPLWRRFLFHVELGARRAVRSRGWIRERLIALWSRQPIRR